MVSKCPDSRTSISPEVISIDITWSLIKSFTKILAMDPFRNGQLASNLAMIDMFLESGATPLTPSLQSDLSKVRKQVVLVDYTTQVVLASSCNDVVL